MPIIFTNPAVDNNDIIYTGGNDKIYAIYPNGTKKWSKNIEDPYSFIINKDSLIVNTLRPDNGLLHSFNLEDGQENWVVDNCKDYVTPALSFNGEIYIGKNNEDGKVYAINYDGSEKWVCDIGIQVGKLRQLTVGNNGNIYAGFSSQYKSNLVCINYFGEIIWNKEILNHRLESDSMTLTEDTIYLGFWDHFLYAMDTHGNKKWETKLSGGIDLSGIAIDENGLLYIGTDKGTIECLYTSGKTKWIYQTKGKIQSTPLLTQNGTLYVGTDEGYFLGLYKDTAKLKFITRLEGRIIGGITLSNDGQQCYVAANDLYAYSLNNGQLLNSIWPKINKNLYNENKLMHGPILRLSNYNDIKEFTIRIHTTKVITLEGNALNLDDDNITIKLNNEIIDNNVSVIDGVFNYNIELSGGNNKITLYAENSIDDTYINYNIIINEEDSPTIVINEPANDVSYNAPLTNNEITVSGAIHNLINNNVMEFNLYDNGNDLIKHEIIELNDDYSFNFQLELNDLDRYRLEFKAENPIGGLKTENVFVNVYDDPPKLFVTYPQEINKVVKTGNFIDIRIKGYLEEYDFHTEEIKLKDQNGHILPDIVNLIGNEFDTIVHLNADITLLTIEATDKGGTDVKHIPVNITETNNPIINIYNPVDYQEFNIPLPNGISITGELFDFYGGNITWELYDLKDYSLIDTNIASVNEDNQFIFNIYPSKIGDFSILIKVSDPGGFSQRSLNIKTIDTRPIVNIIKPIDNVTYRIPMNTNKEITLSGTVIEHDFNFKNIILKDNNDNILKNNIQLVNKNFNEIITLSPGTHILTIEAEDAGGIGTDSITVNVEEIPLPNIIINNPPDHKNYQDDYTGSITVDGYVEHLNNTYITYRIIRKNDNMTIVNRTTITTELPNNTFSFDITLPNSISEFDICIEAQNQSGTVEEIRTIEFKDDPPIVQIGSMPTIKQINNGENHIAIIDTNDKLWIWGDNRYDKCTIPNDLNQYGVLKVSLGNYNSAVIDGNNKLWMWGDNSQYQCDIPTELQGNNKVKNISCGNSNLGIIDNNNRLWIIGSNANNKSLYPDGLDRNGVKKVVCGYNNTAIIDINNKLWVLGDNTYNQCDIPFDENNIQIKDVECGHDHIVAIDIDNKIRAWGRNDYGQCDIPFNKVTNKVKNIKCGYYHTLVIDQSNKYWAFGRCSFNLCSLPDSITINGIKDMNTYAYFNSFIDNYNNFYISGSIDFDKFTLPPEFPVLNLTTVNKYIERNSDNEVELYGHILEYDNDLQGIIIKKDDDTVLKNEVLLIDNYFTEEIILNENGLNRIIVTAEDAGGLSFDYMNIYAIKMDEPVLNFNSNAIDGKIDHSLSSNIIIEGVVTNYVENKIGYILKDENNNIIDNNIVEIDNIGQFSFDLPTLSVQIYTLYITINTLDGIYTGIEVIQVTDEAPTVEITYPPSDQTMYVPINGNKIVTLRGIINEYDTTKHGIIVKEGETILKSNLELINGNEFETQISLIEGIHDIIVQAEDDGGIGSDQIRYTIIEKELCTINVNAPIDQSTFDVQTSNNNINIFGNVDNYFGDRIEYTITALSDNSIVDQGNTAVFGTNKDFNFNILLERKIEDYKIQLKAMDVGGIVTKNIVIHMIDNPPEITITNPILNQTFQLYWNEEIDITINGTVTELDKDNKTVNLLLKNEFNQIIDSYTLDANTNSFSKTVTVNRNLHKIEVNATDLGGTGLDVITVNMDCYEPTIVLTSPSNNELYFDYKYPYEKVLFEGVVQNYGSNTIKYIINDTMEYEVNLQTNNYFLFEIPLENVTLYKVDIIATNPDGKEDIKTVNINVTDNPPDINITNKSTMLDTFYTPTGSNYILHVEGTVTELDLPTEVVIALVDDFVMDNAIPVNSGVFYVDLPITPGVHQVKLEATDPGGTNVDNITITVQETDQPEIIINAPSNNASFNLPYSEDIIVSGIVNNFVGDQINYVLTNSSNTIIYNNVIDVIDNTFTFTLPNLTILDDYNININTSDEGGSDSKNTIIHLIDETPVINLLNPTEDINRIIKEGTDIVINVECEIIEYDKNEQYIRIKNQNDSILKDNITLDEFNRFSVNILLQPGNHILTIEAEDAGGYTSESFNVNIETTIAPTIVIDLPTAGNRQFQTPITNDIIVTGHIDNFVGDSLDYVLKDSNNNEIVNQSITIDETKTFNITLPITEVDSYSLSMTTSDVGGTDSGTIFISLVDNPPIITITNPIEGQQFAFDETIINTITVTGNITEYDMNPKGIKIKDQNDNILISSVTLNPDNTFSQDIEVDNTINRIIVQAEDDGGIGTSFVNINIIETGAPTINIDNTSFNTEYELPLSSDIHILGDVTEYIGNSINCIIKKLDNTEIYNEDITLLSGKAFDITLPIDQMDNYTIILSVTDVGGSDSKTVNINLIDQPPVVTITSPNEGDEIILNQLVNDEYTITGTVTEYDMNPKGIIIKDQGGNILKENVTINSSNVFSETVILNETINQIVVQAEDDGGIGNDMIGITIIRTLSPIVQITSDTIIQKELPTTDILTITGHVNHFINDSITYVVKEGETELLNDIVSVNETDDFTFDYDLSSHTYIKTLTIDITATDPGGTHTNSITINLVDQPPVITITNPTESEFIPSLDGSPVYDLTIEGTITEYDINQEYAKIIDINNSAEYPITLQPDNSFSEVISVNPNTQYNFEIKAKDEGGETIETLDIFIVGDIAIEKVNDMGDYLETDSFIFEWNKVSGQLNHYEVEKDNDGNWIHVNMDTTYEWTSISENTHTFKVKAIDEINQSSNIIEWNFKVLDNIIVEKITPDPIELIESDTYTLEWTLSSGFLSNYFIQIDDNGIWEDILLDNSYTFENLTAGIHNLKTKAIDILGNESNVIEWTFECGTTTQINLEKVTSDFNYLIK